MTGVPLVAALLVLSGCAYKSTTTYTVLNASSQTITVRVSEQGSDGRVTEFTLEKDRRRNIVTDSDYCPENYMPVNRFNENDKLPPAGYTAVLEIWVDGRKLSDDVRMCSLWSYTSTLYSEQYILPVTDEVIAYYSK